jgi:signal peptidase II|tara:strand:- start:471 stop:941 length:471 start_codon:yes stop_codon:yes gene_type:complete
MKQFNWIVLIVIFILGDQWTKNLVVNNLELYERVNTTSFFDITLLYNTGAAFSLFAFDTGSQRIPLILVSIFVSVYLLGFLIKHASTNHCALNLSISMIAGGALGNLVDRITQGYVVDFLLFYYENWYFPAFNVADSLITIGMMIFLIDNFMIKDR